MTSGPVTSSGRWISSTSRPRRTNAVSRSSTDVPAGTSTYSASQPMGTRTGRLLRLTEVTFPSNATVHCSTPNAVVNRTSPSTMSRMSPTPERNCRARSMPMPNANPEYSSGSMPQAIEHPRVDHPAAAPLDPARAVAVLGEPDVELRRRLGEREVRRPPAGDRVGAEQRAGQVVEGAAQVRHGQPAVDRQALDLVEDRGVRRVELVGPVDPAGRHDVDRRRPRRASCAPAPGWCACAAPGRSPRARRRRCPSSCGPGGRGRC